MPSSLRGVPRDLVLVLALAAHRPVRGEPAAARAAVETLFPGRALPDAIPTALAAFGGASGERPTWA